MSKMQNSSSTLRLNFRTMFRMFLAIGWRGVVLPIFVGATVGGIAVRALTFGWSWDWARSDVQCVHNCTPAPEMFMFYASAAALTTFAALLPFRLRPVAALAAAILVGIAYILRVMWLAVVST